MVRQTLTGEKIPFQAGTSIDLTWLEYFCYIAGHHKLLKMVAITHQVHLTNTPHSNYIITNPK